MYTIIFYALLCMGQIEKTDLNNSYYYKGAEYIPKNEIIKYLQTNDLQILEAYE